MGKLFKAYLGEGTIYKCSSCKSHLALHDELVSTRFVGRTGTAYLFRAAINVRKGEQEDRLLRTGLHTVSDLYCIQCDANLGWFYHEAYEQSQKYKVGKFILENALLTKTSSR